MLMETLNNISKSKQEASINNYILYEINHQRHNYFYKNRKVQKPLLDSPIKKFDFKSLNN